MTPSTTVLILDFGSQYTQLIARRVRDLGVFSKIIPATPVLSAFKKKTRERSSSAAGRTACMKPAVHGWERASSIGSSAKASHSWAFATDSSSSATKKADA